MVAGSSDLALDQRTMDILVERVAAEVRGQLEAIVADMKSSNSSHEHLTVAQVAVRLGVARSTVYAHWREWGGFKLSAGEKAPIRFPSEQLPNITAHSRAVPSEPVRQVTTQRRQRRRKSRANLITDTPRLTPATLDIS